MNSCNTSNYWKDRNPIMHTDAEISWSGADIHCENEDGSISIDICNGARLSQANAEFATALCNLISITDAGNITLPTCLVNAWGTQDKTVLNFLTFLLNQHCSQQTQIDSLINTDFTLNTIFEVEYPDCCDDTCIGGTQLKLVEHLEKILLCLCAQATELAALKAYVGNSVDITNLTSEILSLKAQLITANASIASILLKTECLDECP